MLTEQQYVEEGGVRCPHCLSRDIFSDSLEADGKHAYARVCCDNCGEYWDDVFTLTGVSTAPEMTPLKED